MNTMLDGNTAALNRHMDQQDRAIARTRRLIRDNPVSAFEDEAREHVWDENGYEFLVGTQGLLATEERTDALKRILFDSLCMRDYLPADYPDTQRIRDVALLQKFVEEWIEEHARDLRDQYIDKGMLP